MSNLGTSKVDDWKSLINTMQGEVYAAAAQLKEKGATLNAKLAEAGTDAMLTLIHGDDAASKIAYKDTIKAALVAANAPVNNVMNAVKPV